MGKEDQIVDVTNKGINAITEVTSRMNENSPRTNILLFGTVVLIVFLVIYVITTIAGKQDAFTTVVVLLFGLMVMGIYTGHASYEKRIENVKLQEKRNQYNQIYNKNMEPDEALA